MQVDNASLLKTFWMRSCGAALMRSACDNRDVPQVRLFSAFICDQIHQLRQPFARARGAAWTWLGPSGIIQ